MSERQETPGIPNDPDVPDVKNAGGLARFFILTPTFGMLLMVLIIAGGLLAYDSMVKESLPDLEIPQATVTTYWPGADPQSVEQEVTKKIEQELSSLRGLRRYSSASFDSYSMIAVEFVAEANMNESMQLLRAKVNDAEADLPREAEKPTVNQVSVDDRPILSVTLSGDVNAAILSRTAQELEDRLEKVPGVNEVKIGGLREEVVRVQMRPERLVALGISPTAVRDAIQRANRDMPWGDIESDQFGATTRLYGRFRELSDLEELPVARLDGVSSRVVRLDEVAEVRRDLERERTRAYLSWEGGEYRRAIEISLTKVPGTDTLETIAAAKAAIAETASRPDWPHGLEYRYTSDQGDRIWESLLRVFNSGWQAMLFVFLILLVMLTWREALIAGLSIPLTFLGAMAAVWMLGYTLNEMVLIGMVLALGMLVDVFILKMEGMHEGIYIRHLTFGQAALRTIRRFALPAFAGQMTTILALAPLMAVSGTSGKFIRILPITAICCLIMSFIVAVLIDIPLSRYLLPGSPRNGDRKTLIDRATLWLGNRLAAWNFHMTLSSRGVAGVWVAFGLGLFVLSGMAFSTLPTMLYSERDGRDLGVTVELPAGATLRTSQECADLVGEILRQKPYLQSAVKLVGQKSPMSGGSLTEALAPTEGNYLVGFSCLFTPRDQRDKPAYEYVEDLRREITEAVERHYPGASVILAAETGKPEPGDPVQIEIMGDDMETLRDLSKQVQQILAQTPGAVDVRDNLGNVRVDVRLEPKREALDFYGITAEQLADQVRFAMADQEVGHFALGGTKEDLEIRLGMAWPSRTGELGGPTSMQELMTVRAFRNDGQAVPLGAVVEPRTGTAPISITRKEGQRSIVVSSKNQGRLPSEILADVTPVLEQQRQDWPTGYTFRLGGEAEESAEAFGSAGKAMVVALFLVFALLVLLFGSFSQPFIIVLTIPMGLTGTFTGFFLLGMPFSFTAMIGIISLIGIAVNNAIVMVETMNYHLRQGVTVREAAAIGGAERLRPILSTSITTTMGLLPLMLSDPMWEPLCGAIIFGLAASTVFSLLLIPPLFLLLTRSPKIAPETDPQMASI